jgi:glucokinase
VTVIGLDVGGSKIAAGSVDLASGEVLQLVRRPTRAGDGGAAVLRSCVEAATEVAGGGPAAVGIGICEFVDPAGAVTSGVTIDWRALDVPAAFAALGSVRVESDVRAAARAEARFGAGAAFDTFLYVTVGTGVSFCHVVGGIPSPGHRGNAIVVGAPPVERGASGRALAERAGLDDAAAVLEDPSFDELVEEAAGELGLGLAALVNAFDPEGVVIGGGLGLVRRYRELAVARARAAIDAETTRDLPILPSALGELSGVVGAALAAGE